MTEASPSTPSAPVDPVQAGRDALIRHAWPEAFEQLSRADGDGQLSGSDLEALALAAFFAARADVELEVKERAFMEITRRARRGPRPSASAAPDTGRTHIMTAS